MIAYYHNLLNKVECIFNVASMSFSYPGLERIQGNIKLTVTVCCFLKVENDTVLRKNSDFTQGKMRGRVSLEINFTYYMPRKMFFFNHF